MVKRALLAFLLAFSTQSLAQSEKLARGEKISIPAGTVFHCRTTETLTTKLNSQGQSFSAAVSEPIVLNGRAAIPAGATIMGRIALLEKPRRLKGVAKMRLNAETIILPGGRTFPLGAVLLTVYGADNVKVDGTEGTVKGPGSVRDDIKEIGGGSAVGSLVGLIFSHPWVGVAVGGTAGFADRLRRGGKDLTLPAGTQLNYQLTRSLELHREYSGVASSEPSMSASN
jgi:hypothetical protein